MAQVATFFERWEQWIILLNSCKLIIPTKGLQKGTSGAPALPESKHCAARRLVLRWARTKCERFPLQTFVGNIIKILSRIIQLRILRVVQDFPEVFFCIKSCHRKVHVQVVAAVFCGSPGNFSLEGLNELKHFFYQWENIGRFVISAEQEIESGTAAHGTEVEYTVFELRMVPQEGCS